MGIFYNWKLRNFYYDIEYFALSDNIDWDKEKKKQAEINQLNSTLVKRYIDLFMHGHSYDKRLVDISRLYNMMGKCNLTIQPFLPIAIQGSENITNQKWLFELCADTCNKIVKECCYDDNEEEPYL